MMARHNWRVKADACPIDPIPIENPRAAGRRLGILFVVDYVVVQFRDLSIFAVTSARQLDHRRASVSQSNHRRSAWHNWKPISSSRSRCSYLTSTVTLDPAAIDFTFDITETARLAHEARTRRLVAHRLPAASDLAAAGHARYSRRGQLLRRKSARLSGRGRHPLRRAAAPACAADRSAHADARPARPLAQHRRFDAAAGRRVEVRAAAHGRSGRGRPGRAAAHPRTTASSSCKRALPHFKARPVSL